MHPKVALSENQREYEVCFEGKSDDRDTICAYSAKEAVEKFMLSRSPKDGDWSVEVHYGTEWRTFSVEICTVREVIVVETTVSES